MNKASPMRVSRRQWIRKVAASCLALTTMPWSGLGAQAQVRPVNRKNGHLVIVGGAEDRL